MFIVFQTFSLFGDHKDKVRWTGNAMELPLRRPAKFTFILLYIESSSRLIILIYCTLG